MGKIEAICISEQRGTKKKVTKIATLQENWGIVQDAHGGNWHRQVSLLSAEKVDDFREKGATINQGDFGENLLIKGIDVSSLPVGTWLKSGEILLEITQIGKECHNFCEIYHEMGDCIMPREGVFAQVLQGGILSQGDEIQIVPRQNPLPFRSAVITLSDRCFQGKQEDISGKILSDLLIKADFQVLEQIILPDEQEKISETLRRLADQRQLDLVLTTGGTGLAPRDVTPEATLAVAERQVPGISEGIRRKSLEITSKAMLSRGVSVIRGKTLVINLPGSPKACRECFDIFQKILPHTMEVLRGEVISCGGT